MLGTSSSRVLSIPKDGDSKTSQGNRLKCLTTSTERSLKPVISIQTYLYSLTVTAPECCSEHSVKWTLIETLPTNLAPRAQSQLLPPSGRTSWNCDLEGWHCMERAALPLWNATTQACASTGQRHNFATAELVNEVFAFSAKVTPTNLDKCRFAQWQKHTDKSRWHNWIRIGSL